MVIIQHPDADQRWCERLRGPVAAALLDLGLPGLAVNVRDDPVRESLLTLTTLNPPAAAVVSMWTQQYYGEPTQAAIALLQAESDAAAAYLVTESVPMPPPDPGAGQRTPGLANIALLRRPAELDPADWLRRWHLDHTRVAIDTQGTFGYTQNVVVRALTDGAPIVVPEPTAEASAPASFARRARAPDPPLTPAN